MSRTSTNVGIQGIQGIQGVPGTGAVIGDAVTGGTTGSVLFIGAATVLQQDNANFFYNDTTNRLGIGTDSPDARLDIKAQGALVGDVAFKVGNSADSVVLVQFNGDGSFQCRNNDGNTVLLAPPAGSIYSYSFGYQALNSTTIGTDNIAIGEAALKALTSGQYCVAIGTNAGLVNNGNELIAIGYGAAKSNTSGTNNVSVGVNSLNSNVTGANNTAIGTNALFSNNSSHCTAVGSLAMNSYVSGDDSTAVGYYSMGAGTGGLENTAIGAFALFGGGTNGDNTAVGKDSLFSCAAAADNTGIGVNAGYNVSTGNFNTFLGRDAGSGITTGSYNVIIGKGTGLATTLANVVALYDGQGAVAIYSDANRNVGIGTSTFQASMTNGITMINGTAPSANVANSGALYVEGGALKYRGSSGTVTTLGAA